MSYGPMKFYGQSVTVCYYYSVVSQELDCHPYCEMHGVVSAQRIYMLYGRFTESADIGRTAEFHILPALCDSNVILNTFKRKLKTSLVGQYKRLSIFSLVPMWCSVLGPYTNVLADLCMRASFCRKKRTQIGQLVIVFRVL